MHDLRVSRAIGIASTLAGDLLEDRNMKVRAATLTLVFIGVVGCNAAPALGERQASSKSSIINGSASGKEQDAVVLLTMASGGLCTATLVAPNLILTARHCVSDLEEGGILCRPDGTSEIGGDILRDIPAGDLSVYLGQRAVDDWRNERPAAARGKRVITNGARNICGGDAALVLLDRDLRAPIARIRTASGAQEGETLTGVGWGLTEAGTIPTQRMTRSGVRVTDVGPVDDLTASEFMTGESACSGDSGGPMLSAKGAVVGVVSRGGGGDGPEDNAAGACMGSGSREIFVQLEQQKALLDQAFALAGYEPLEENDPPRAMLGAVCRNNNECASLACVEGACRDRCTADADCGTKMECASAGSFRACTPKPPPIEPAPPSASEEGDETKVRPTDDDGEEADDEETTAPRTRRKPRARSYLQTTNASCTGSPVGTTSTPYVLVVLFFLFTIIQARRPRTTDSSRRE